MKYLLILIMLFSLSSCSSLQDLITNKIVEEAENSLTTIVTRVKGSAILSGSSNHSDISILMRKQSDNISSQSLDYQLVGKTSKSGAFELNVISDNTLSTQSLELPLGYYSVKFEKTGFIPKIVENVPIIMGQGVYQLEDVVLKPSHQSSFKLFVTSHDWMATGIYLEKGETLSGVINGQFVWHSEWGDQPSHWAGWQLISNFETRDEYQACLVFKVGDNGTVTDFYRSFEHEDYSPTSYGSITARESGFLFLRITEYENIGNTGTSDLSGSITVVFD